MPDVFSYLKANIGMKNGDFMKRVIIIRHAESEGNYRRIIQGTKVDYSITTRGSEICGLKAEILKSQLANSTRIMCSTSKRACRTAEIIKESIGLQCAIRTNSLLKEMDAGILAGHTHQEAEELYPREYNIWINRKDLDGIKGSEKGDCLQARALAFLVQYFGCDEYNDLIVSHAGFMRSLINTVNADSREKQIDIPNCAHFMLDDLWGKINYKIIIKKPKCLIIHVQTVDAQYIIKRYNRIFDDFELELDNIQNKVQTIHDCIPEVYFSGNIVTGTGQKYGVRVYSYIKGNHIYDEIGEEKVLTIIKKIECLILEYNKYNITKCCEMHSLFYKIENINYNNMSPRLTVFREKIFNNQDYLFFRKQEKQILTLYDLHRENVLFDDNNIAFIDMESVILAPEAFQAAVLVVATFMLYSINDGMVCLKYYFNRKRYGLKEIKLWMQIRIFMGVSYFENCTIYNREKYLNLYWDVYEVIDNIDFE